MESKLFGEVVKIEPRFAVIEDIKQLESFFSKHVTRENKAVYNEEFICPLGLRAAVKKRSVVVMSMDDIIIAAARIYLKKNGTISLYQFAVAERYRHKNLMRYLLSQIGYPVFSSCPSNLKFNNYYMDSKWSFIETKKGMNIWKLEPDILSESTFPNISLK